MSEFSHYILLPNVSGFSGNAYWIPTGINNDGLIYGNTYYGYSDNNYYYGYAYATTLLNNIQFTFYMDPSAYFSTYYLDGYYHYENSYDTIMSGINDSGAAVGYFLSNTGYDAFELNYSTGIFVNMPEPDGTFENTPTAINDLGQVIGTYYSETAANYVSYIYSGGASGVYSTLPTLTPGLENFATALNNQAQIVGYFYNNITYVYYAYIYNINSGDYTILPQISPTANYVTPKGINDAGIIVGEFRDGGNTQAFVYSGGANGTYAILPNPTSTTYYVDVGGINNANEIVGVYYDATGQHNFELQITSPTVDGIAFGPATALNLESSDTITLQMSDPVTVSGTPTLQLSDGGIATYDASQSSGSTLVFDYRVAATDQSVSSLAANSVALPPGASIDGVGIAANLSLAGLTQAGPAVDTTAPTVSSIAISPATGVLAVGQKGAITIVFSKPVTLSGAPTLSLDNGATATFDPAASATAGVDDVVFDYTPATTDQATSELIATAITLSSGGSIDDAGGNAADLSLSGVTQTGPRVIITSSSLASISANSALNDLGVGATATFVLGFTNAVTVTGAPSLQLNDGGSATFDAVKTAALNVPSKLVFDYRVTTSDASVPSISVTGVQTPTGAAIIGPYGLAASLSLTGVVQRGPQVDTTAPSVGSVTATPASGDEGIGDQVTIAVAFNKAVTVSGGVPTLALNDGGAASYAGTVGDTLDFIYNVAAADRSEAALAVTGLAANGATIADAAGNVANLVSLAQTFTGLAVDTTPPTVVSIAAASSGATDLGVGQQVAIALTFSKPVFVQGTPALALKGLGAAAYLNGAGTDTLTFTYVVQAGDTASALSITALEAGQGSVADAAGNAPSGPVAQSFTLTIDGVAPTVTSMSASSDNGALDLDAGHIVTIQVDLSKPVIVTGAPTLQLNDKEFAVYQSGSGTSALTFQYVVANGDTTPDLQVVGLVLAGGSILDAAGNALSSVSGDLGLQIDTTAPVATGLSAHSDTGALDINAGHVVTFTVSLSRPVIVDTTNGSPSLSLNNQGVATYAGVAGAPTSTLTFVYTSKIGDTTADLGVADLVLGGANIDSLSGAALSGGVTGATGIAIDTTPPTLTSLTATTDNGAAALDAGHVITITATFSKPVLVNTSGGTPSLQLNDNESAAYKSGSGSTTLTFDYTVRPNDNVGDLAVTGLALAGATIADAAGNAITGAVTGALGLQIDTIAPTTSIFATTSENKTDLKAGDTVDITLSAATSLYVTGAPGLMLSDLEVAAYVGGSGTSSLTFAYTVLPGDLSTDLAVTGVATAGGTIRDRAGNAPAGVSADLALTVDTSAPTIISLAATSDNGALDLDAGRIVTITLTTSKPVEAENAPTLALDDGGVATYVSGSGTNTLTFSYTVAAGAQSSDLTIEGLGQGAVVDAAGNAIASVSGALGLKVDTSAPIVTQVAATAGNGASIVGEGVGVTITVTTSKPVSIGAGAGVPTLNLSDGGTAVYKSGSGTNSLTFLYLVAPNDVSSDLKIVGLQGNGVTVGDAAGNALATFAGDLSLAIDGVIPSVVSASASPSLTALPGQTVEIEVKLSDAVTVKNGVPTLTLNDGGLATYDAVSTAALDDPTKLVFDYPVALSQSSTAALTVTSVALDGATVANAVGTNAALAGLDGLSLGVGVDTRLLWVSGATGAWSSAANWSAGVVPGPNNNAYVEGASLETLEAAGAVSAASLTIDDPNATLEALGGLTLGGNLSSSGGLILGEIGGAYGDETLTANTVTLNASGVLLARGDVTIDANVVNNSSGIGGNALDALDGVVSEGLLDITGALSGGGGAAIGAAATLEIGGASSQTVQFFDGGYGGATLRLDNPATFGGDIEDISAGGFTGPTDLATPPADVIDLGGFLATSAVYDNDLLSVEDASGHKLAFNVTGASPTSLTNTTLALASDGRGGTDVSFQPGLSLTWANPGGGAWSQASNWSPDLVPQSYDTVVIGGEADRTITIGAAVNAQANLLSISDPNATLAIAGILTLGDTPSLGGATLDIEGGHLDVYGGELDDVTIEINGGSIVGDVTFSPLGLYDLQPVLTIGAGVTISQTVAGSSDSAGISAGSYLVNDGVIDASASGGSFGLSVSGPEQGSNSSSSFNQGPGIIENQGLIEVENGDTFAAGPVFDNQGQIAIGAGSNASLGGLLFSNQGAISIAAGDTVGAGGWSWSNSGTITLGVGGVLTLTGDYTTDDVANIQNDGGTLILDGAPTNDGYVTQYYPNSGLPMGAGAGDSTLYVSGGTTIINPAAQIPIDWYDYPYYFSDYGSQDLLGQQISNGATFEIDAGATLEFEGDPQDDDVTSGRVIFNGAGATLRLDALGFAPPSDPSGQGPPYLGLVPRADFSGAISGLAFGDAIDLANATVASISYGYSLTITTTDDRYVSLSLDQNVWADEFSLASDGHGGTLIEFHADTTPPAITEAIATTSTGAEVVGAGATVTITLKLREAVEVTGAPTLKLSNGAEALYSSGSGSDELVFSYTVAAGQDTSDLQVAGLDYSAGSIADLAGNALSSSYGADVAIDVDAAPPTVVKVLASPAEGVLRVNQTATITVVMSQAVSAGASAPYLTLSDGGVATYDAAATAALGAADELVFDYTVGLGDASASSLSVTGALAAVSVVDPAGTQADFSGLTNASLGVEVDTNPVVTGATTPQAYYFIAASATSPATNSLYETTGASAEIVAGFDDVSNIVSTKNAIYFWGNDETLGYGIWRIDPSGQIGEVSGVIAAAPTSIAVLGDDVFYSVAQQYAIDPYGNLTGGGLSVVEVSGLTALEVEAQSWPSAAPLSNQGLLYAAGDEVYFSGFDDNTFSATLYESNASGQVSEVLAYPSNPFGGFGNPNPQPAEIDGYLATAGDTLYFSTDDGVFATTNGSTPVATGVSLSYEQYASLGDELFYFLGNSLYATEGASTVGLGSFNQPSDVVASDGEILFVATDPAGNAAIYATGGQSPKLVASGAGLFTNVNNPIQIGAETYFEAENAQGGYTVWQSDGTAAGTEQVQFDGRDLYINGVATFEDLNGNLLFNAYSGRVGSELFETSGATGKATLVADLSPGSSPNGGVHSTSSVGSEVYFSAANPVAPNSALWRTDGTVAGTSVVDDDAQYSRVFDDNGAGYFNLTDPVTDVTSLWRISSAGAAPALALATSPGAPGAAFDGSLYFNGAGVFSWSPSGGAPSEVTTAAGAALPNFTAVYNTTDALFLGSYNGLYAITSAGGAAVEVASGIAGDDAADVGDELYFANSSGGLWKSNATVAGTVEVVADTVYDLTAIGDTLYFESNDDLFVSNGTEAGTRSIPAGSGSLGYQSALTAVGSELYFLAYENNHWSLWQSDGTNTGTHAVATAPYAPLNNVAMTAYGGALYYFATDAFGDLGLYETVEATGATSELVSAQGLFTSVVGDTPLVEAGGYLYFEASPTGAATELWRTDGTQAGTIALTSDLSADSTTFGTFTPAPPSAVSGFVEDGYIAGATVFRDANGDGIWEPGEAETTTNADGSYTLVGGSGPIVVEGGTDLATGKAFTGTLEAPAGYTVVSDLSTIVEDIAGPDADAAQVASAQEETLQSLGVQLGQGQSLATLDPIAGATAGDPAATALFVANAALGDTLSTVGALLSASDGQNEADAANAAAMAIAAQAESGSLDLSNASQISDVIDTAATILDPSKPTGVSAPRLLAASQAIADSNAAVTDASQGTTSSASVVSSVNGDEQTAQVQIASELSSGAPLTIVIQSPPTGLVVPVITDASVSVGSDGAFYINAAHFDGGATTLSGTVTAGDSLSVSVNGGAAQSAPVSSSGSWSLTLTGLVSGSAYTAVATASDSAGDNASGPPLTFNVKTSTSESAVSDASMTTGADGELYLNAANFNGGAATLTGTAEVGDYVSVSVNGGQSEAATVSTDGVWTFDLNGLSNSKTYSVIATATDAAGNTDSSAPYAFTVDTTPTTESAIADTAVTIAADGSLAIDAADFDGGTTTLTGAAAAGDTVTVSVDGGASEAATVSPSGSWSLALTGLDNGQSYTAVATATDTAGNTATSSPFTFAVDAAPTNANFYYQGGAAATPLQAASSDAVLIARPDTYLEVTGADDTILTGASVTLEANGANETIWAASGDTLWLSDVTGDVIEGSGVTVEAAAGADFAIGGAGAADVVVGGDAIVSVQANASVTVWGGKYQIDVGADATLAAIGDNETIAAASGDAIWLGAVTGDVITGAGFSVHVGAGTNITIGDNGTGAVDTVGGADATVTVQADATAEFWGDNYRIDLGAAATLAAIGDNETISATSGDTIWLGAVTGDVITGAGFSVHVGAGTSITIGDNGTGAVDTVGGADATVAVQGNTNAEFWGDNYQIDLGADATLAAIGDNETISAASGDTIWLGAVTGDVITGSEFSVHVGAGTNITIGDNGSGAVDTVGGADATVAVQGDTSAEFWGDNYQIDLGADATLAAIGDNETISAAGGDTIWLGAVTGDVITGAGFAVHASNGATLSFGGGGASSAAVAAAGSGVSWTLLSGSNADFWGNSNAVTSEGGSVFSLFGTNDIATAGAADGIYVSSSNDSVTAAAGDAISDLGTGLTVGVGVNSGSFSLSDFAADKTGVIDLLSGAGGYASANAAWSNLIDDGAGGSTLSLGAEGAIHLIGATKAMLSASNFNIG